MRILKEKTSPLSCRVSVEMKHQIENMADKLDLSLAQYVAILISIGQTGETGSKVLQDRLAESHEKQYKMLHELKELSSFKTAVFAGPLASLLQNEQILKTLHEQYGNTPFDKTVLATTGFQFHIMLQAKSIDKTNFYFMGIYGWNYSDRERKTVTIIKCE